MGPVLGAQNPRVVELRRLLRRRNSRSEWVVIEGPRAVGEAMAAGHQAETVVIPESSVEAPEVVAVLDQLPTAATVLVVRDRAFDQLAPSTSPQPMMALVPRPQPSLPQLGPTAVVLVLVEIADPGNLGTLIRSADAVAADAVVVVGGADPWSPKALRSAAGSMLRIPVVARPSAGDALDELKAQGLRTVGTNVRQGQPHHQGVVAPPVAIVVGSEAHGLDEELEVDDWAHIAMPGPTESLNAAMAGTLLLFEARRGD